MRRILPAQVAHEAHLCALACSIDSHILVRPDLLHAPNGHNAAPSLVKHGRRITLNQQQGCAQVHVDLPGKLLRCDFIPCAAILNAGIEYQNIDITRLPVQAIRAFHHTQVLKADMGIARHSAGCRLTLFHACCAMHIHLCMLCSQACGDCLADALCRARHKRPFPRQIKHDALHLLPVYCQAVPAAV